MILLFFLKGLITNKKFSPHCVSFTRIDSVIERTIMNLSTELTHILLIPTWPFKTVLPSDVIHVVYNQLLVLVFFVDIEKDRFQLQKCSGIK